MLRLDEAHGLAKRALIRAGASDAAAHSTAQALVAAERDGQSGHGLSRVASYAAQLRAGKVVGSAVPQLEQRSAVAMHVDAGLGFAYPAIDAAIEWLGQSTVENGMAIALISRSHHFGQAGAHVERLAELGLMAFLFGNSPKAMAFWGGRVARLGTNPIAFATPVPGGSPLVIDLALSVAARGRILAAAKQGQTIPPDWALDADGQPTTDPAAALAGTMAPLGGAKGAALALMVEIIAATLTGAHFGWEASSFLDAAGPPPDVGQVFLTIDPVAISAGAYPARMATLLLAMADEDGVRLPGSRRIARRATATAEGLSVTPALLAELRELAGEATA